jgi:hypothetical protein
VRAVGGPQYMRILATEDGRIIGGFFPGIAEGDNPPSLEIVPGEGEIVREVELPDGLLREGGLDVETLLSYRLEVGGETRLKRSDDSPGAASNA